MTAPTSPLEVAPPTGEVSHGTAGDGRAALAPRRVLRKWLTLIVMASLAAGIPFVATAVAYGILKPAGRLEAISVGFVTGLAVGQLVGIQRRRLAAFLYGPAIGMLIGFLDLRAFVWFYSEAEWPLDFVSILPVWGFGFGLWISCYYRRWRYRLLVFVTIVGLNFLSQLTWLYLPIEVHQKWGESIIYLEPVVFVPPVVAVVLLTPIPRPLAPSSHASAL